MQTTLKAACDEATRVSETTWRQTQNLRERSQVMAAELDEQRGKLQKDRGRLTSLEALQEAALHKAVEGATSISEITRALAKQEASK